MECSTPSPCHPELSRGTAPIAPDRANVTGALQAIVFREILKPLAAGLGPVGEIAVGSVADKLFARPTT
jgi:hypothetical protein